MQTMTENRAHKLLDHRGFTLMPDPGFVTGRRTLSDGAVQQIKFFTWSNPEVADRKGIPRGYVVLELSLNGTGIEGRHRVPVVHWPSATQDPRPWADIAAEIDETFLGLFDAPFDEAIKVLASLPSRYRL